MQRRLTPSSEPEKQRGKGWGQAKPLLGHASTPPARIQPGSQTIPHSTGRSLDPAAKTQLEQSFDTNLDSVRVHDDSATQAFVKGRHARAVTFGQDIYLGPDVHSDNAAPVSHTLAHEVAHTLQQKPTLSQNQGYDPYQYMQLEQQADQAADRVTQRQPATVAHSQVGAMEQAEGETTDAATEVSPEVRMAEVLVLLTKTMSAEERTVLQSHPPTYHRVVHILIEYDARWVKDKLLESWVDDEDEATVVATLRRWALTPKLEGGNYLDDLLDELRLYSYYYDYFVSESVSVNMLDKLYAEMEDERYDDLLAVIDTFSVKYAGYRGRGDIGRWSGLQTAVMPTEVRDRLSRVNQRLAGKVTLPMTAEEVVRINGLYAELRSKTLGLIDMPDLQLGPDAGQQAAQALAVPVVGVAALVYALILAILITITITLIIDILIEIERALDRLEFSSEPSPVPVPGPPVAPPVPAPPIAPPVPVPIPVPAPPIAPPIPVPIPVPSPNPPPTIEPEPEPRPTPEPSPGPEPIIDIFPPMPDGTERRRRRKQPIDLYHGTDEPQAYMFAAGDPVQAIGGGEFGEGFYTFRDLAPAELAAAQYTRARGLPMWGVVDFAIPLDVLIAYGLATALLDWIVDGDSVLIFPDRTTAVTVRYPDDLGGIEVDMNWQDFRDENRRLGGHASWPYDLIIGPLSGRIPGWRDVNQFLFNNWGVQMLNDPAVDRSVASSGPT